MDNRDLFESTQGVKINLPQQHNIYQGCIDELWPETSMVVITLILFIYQIGLAYRLNHHDSIYRNVLQAVFYIPLSIVYGLAEVFRVVLFYFVFTRFINNSHAQTARQEEQNIQVSYIREENLITLADTDERIPSDQVIINIEI